MQIPNRAYANLILLFALVALSFFASGLLLFHLRYGWTLTDLTNTFQGSPSKNGMSPEYLLKVSVPHTLVIGLFTFIFGHFLIFAEPFSLGLRKFIAYGLIVSGLINANIGWLILFTPQNLAILKLISFLVFQFYFFTTAVMIFISFKPSLQMTSVDLSKKT